MSLSQWRENGWLTPHETNRVQVTHLVSMVDRDLEVAGATANADWRFGIAYNAALKLCTVLLYGSGYRAARELNHYRTLMSLPLILGAERAADAAYLDRCRSKRNELEYDRAGVVTEADADELIDFTRSLKGDVLAWLGSKRPELM